MQKKVIMLIMATLVAISLVSVGQGLYMHSQVTRQEQEFHQLQDSYFSLSKTEREAAPTDSDLNKDLVRIQNFPSELLRLKLVGVGRILIGIFATLIGILIALVMMPKRMAGFIKENK